MIERTFRLPLPVDLRLTLRPLKLGARDPSLHEDDRGGFVRATRTPEGPAAARYVSRSPHEVHVQAWGKGGAWAIEHAPQLLGVDDSLEGFAPEGPLRAIHRRFAGLRLARTGAVFEALVPAILGQLVTGREAERSLGAMTRAWSEPAPGPHGEAGSLWLPLAPDALAARPPFELFERGVESKRAGALRAAARVAPRLEELATRPPVEARRALESLPGIGPWTSAHVALEALGDPDAVPLGDYHLPHTVTFAFTGAARGTEAQMLALLAPYAGHRARVIRLIHAAGIAAPRFGPRRPLRQAPGRR